MEPVKLDQLIERTGQGVIENASALGRPDPGDVARFEHAMKGEILVAQNSQPVPREKGVGPVEGNTQTVGDAILNTLEKVRAAHNEKLEDVNASLEKMRLEQDFSPREILKLQWQVFQAMFQVEITTKVVDKSDQGVNTLLRSQG
jgi:type III secretion system YscI/HrpB-like protein